MSLLRGMTESIRLEPTQAHDLPLISALEQQQENSAFILPYDSGRHLQALANPDELHLKILQGSDQLVGFVLLAGVENQHRSIEFRRIVIAQKGRGLGRLAIQQVKQHCFMLLNCHRLWLDVFEDNLRARHLYNSEGFVEEGIMRECIRQGETYRSLVLMSMLKQDYNPPDHV